jgi:hypothetical protein
MTEMITTLTRRFSRHALPQPNLVYYLWRFVANGLRTFRALTTAASQRDIPAIAQELTTEGIVVGPSDRFLTEDGRGALRDAAASVLEASRRDDIEAVISGAGAADERQKKFLVHLVSYPSGIPTDDPILKVALDRKLLEIVASYLGLWPCLHSVDAWVNYPTDAPPETSQLWHRDPEDLRLVKAFIYLVDVDAQCGPFTYIPKTHPFGAAAAGAPSLAKKKRIPDDHMTRKFARESWRVCTGPANTMILADTLGYHRGGKPEAGRRILITFTYTSGVPITDPPVWVAGMPTWISSGIQAWAVNSCAKRKPVQRSKQKKGQKQSPRKTAHAASGVARDVQHSDGN